MIATILPSCSTFAGIDYSKKKIDKGLAELVEAYNFGYLDLVDNKKMSDYQEYLNRWSERNTRIKNPQFHVSISCKGNSHTKNQLCEIAKQWLLEMGYADNPTLLFFHSDTKNNHIHIVTSRVDKNGKKIDNDFENYRARAAINQIMKNDIVQKCRNDFANSLTYKYDNINQFQAILESRGYNVSIDNDIISVSKENMLLLKIDQKIVDWNRIRIQRTKDPRRIKQLKAVLYKYRDRFTFPGLSNFMKKGFGCDFVVFGEKTNPYGYMIIDHKIKKVYKGNEIMNLKELLSKCLQNEDFKLILNSLFDIPNITTKNINDELRKYGVYIYRNNLIDKYTKDIISVLDDKDYNKLKYNNLCYKINQFSIRNERDQQILANLFDVHPNDIPINQIKVETHIKESVIQSYLRGSYSNSFRLVNYENNKYLIDFNLNCIIDLDDKLANGLKLIYTSETHSTDKNYNELLDVILANDLHHFGGSVDNELKKRRKR